MAVGHGAVAAAHAASWRGGRDGRGGRAVTGLEGILVLAHDEVLDILAVSAQVQTVDGFVFAHVAVDVTGVAPRLNLVGKVGAGALGVAVKELSFVSVLRKFKHEGNRCGCRLQLTPSLVLVPSLYVKSLLWLGSPKRAMATTNTAQVSQALSACHN